MGPKSVRFFLCPPNGRPSRPRFVSRCAGGHAFRVSGSSSSFHAGLSRRGKGDSSPQSSVRSPGRPAAGSTYPFCIRPPKSRPSRDLSAPASPRRPVEAAAQASGGVAGPASPASCMSGTTETRNSPMRPPPARLRKDLSQASTAEWLFGDATPIVPHFHGVSYPRVYCILGYRSIIYTNLNNRDQDAHGRGRRPFWISH